MEVFCTFVIVYFLSPHPVFMRNFAAVISYKSTINLMDKYDLQEII
jgi:hypothetical protein